MNKRRFLLFIVFFIFSTIPSLAFSSTSSDKKAASTFERFHRKFSKYVKESDVRYSKEYEYDVKKTNSLVAPYKAFIKLHYRSDYILDVKFVLQDSLWKFHGGKQQNIDPLYYEIIPSIPKWYGLGPKHVDTFRECTEQAYK